MRYPKVGDIYKYSSYSSYFIIKQVFESDGVVEIRMQGGSWVNVISLSLLNQDFIKATEMDKVLYANY